MPTRTDLLGTVAFLVLILGGCSGEPSEREVNNAQAFEALLTAVSLHSSAEVERDAVVIEQRHTAGKLTDSRYQALLAILTRARQQDWAAAEKLAYEFRAPFGDQGAFFR